MKDRSAPCKGYKCHRGNVWAVLLPLQGVEYPIFSLDNSDYKNISLTSSVYLQTCTIGGTDDAKEPKQYALNINSTPRGSLAGTAGRATGLMIRPVKYVRVE